MSGIICSQGGHLTSGQMKLDWEVDKKIVDGQRLVSILHSSHERHDDSLHEGECIYILFTRLLMVRAAFAAPAFWRLC